MTQHSPAKLFDMCHTSVDVEDGTCNVMRLGSCWRIRRLMSPCISAGIPASETPEITPSKCLKVPCASQEVTAVH